LSRDRLSATILLGHTRDDRVHHGLGASLVAISPQRPSYGRAARRRAALEFDVLSDAGLKVAQACGLVFTLPSYLEELYRSFGKTLDEFHGEPAYRLPSPARYVVDR
jgi:peroxiredoxin